MTVLPYVLLAVAFAGAAWRIARGPHIADRAVGSDLVTTAVVAAAAWLAAGDPSGVFSWFVLVAACVSIVTPIAFGWYLSHHPDEEVET